MTTQQKINQIISEKFNDYSLPGGNVIKQLHDIIRNRVTEEMFLDYLLNYSAGILTEFDWRTPPPRKTVYIKPIYRLQNIRATFNIGTFSADHIVCVDSGLGFSLN